MPSNLMRRSSSRGKIPRGDRVQHAYERLREMIVHGRLAPGTRIIETEVADRLGVSRTPVRSALQRLQQEGYIVGSERGQQSRPTVAALTKEDAREVFGIVGELEALAARLAAMKPLEERSRVAEELTRINAELLAAFDAERPDHNRVFDLDIAFHQRFVEAGAGPRLLALHGSIKPLAERYERLYVSALVGEIQTSVEEHEAIVRAIRCGDPDAAQRAVQTNWRNAAERLSRIIASLGERGSW